MKLIIEIPEGLYYRAKWNQYAMKDNRVMREIIANGTPLDDIKLASAENQAKTGHWMNSDIPESMLSKCSVCGWNLGAYTHKFCANCGARMIKEGETIAEYIDKHVKDIPYKGVEPWEGR